MRHANRTKAFGFRFAVVLCGAVTTILIGLHSVSEPFQPLVKDFALFFSALVTAISALDAFYNYRALWIRYTVTYTELRTLSTKVEYLTANGPTSLEEDRIDQLFEEFQQIIRETNSNWLQLRKETEPKPRN
jgi:hypothetical protein